MPEQDAAKPAQKDSPAIKGETPPTVAPPAAQAPTPAAPPPAPAPPGSSTVEDHARDAGHITVKIDRNRRGGIARQREVIDPFFAAAKAHGGWAVGKEMSRAEYDDAIKAAKNIVIR